MKALPVLFFLPAMSLAQSAVTLDPVAVYSTRVANQAPVGTFAMPVSALRYEPVVDLQARNLAEGQADVTVRGGIFENTGWQVGAVTLLDPQTAHYLAEIPVAPAMLGASEIVTGADLTLGATNATAGALRQEWQPIRSRGFVTVGAGEHALRRGEWYQGIRRALARDAGEVGVDVSAAWSASDGSVPHGDHRFERFNLRGQWRRGAAQTDLFAGYQAKFFGWPNLYTPFNSAESENLQTTLFLLNHRVASSAGDFWELGVVHRRNKDDYAFNRFAPLGAVHPFQHTTWLTGAALSGRRAWGPAAVVVRAEQLADEIDSTSLTFGPYRTRQFTRLAVIPEYAWERAAGARVVTRAGFAFDDTNRDPSAWSPVVEVARESNRGPWRRVYASFTETSQVATYTALKSSATAGLFRGNPNLGRQTSRTFEVGASHLFGDWTTHGALFWREDRALVDWTFARGVTARTANAVDLGVGGVELVVRRGWMWGEIVLGYTGLTKDADYRGAAVDASFYALNYARHRLTAAVVARLGRDFEVRIDNVARVQEDNALRRIGGDETLLTSLGFTYRPRGAASWSWSLQADNLWDANFQEIPAVPAARRQLSAGLTRAW